MKLLTSPLVEKVIGLAIDVHDAVGPGLLESAYEPCLAFEFLHNGIAFERQVAIPMKYKGVSLDCGYRADFVVDGTLLVEIKSVDRLVPLHTAQMLTYLKLTGLRQGLILNFNVTRLVNGMKSVVHRLGE
jgi:GxxExxY protein